MNVDGNENNPHSHGKKFTDFYCHYSCYNILNDDCKNFSDFQSTVHGVFRTFVFQRLVSSFLRNCISVARLSTVCIYTILFCCACLRGNETGMKIAQRESHGDRNKT